MLSSRYAPVVATTVLAVVLVVVLGWFLGIKPQLDEADKLRAETREIKDNTAILVEASAELDGYTKLLEASEETDDLLALNAPQRIDIPAARERIAANVVASGAEIVSFRQAEGVLVPGWEADPAVLKSNQVARLFAQGPVAVSNLAEGEAPWQTPVPLATEVGPVAKDLRMVQFELQIAGTTAEVHAFLTAMMDPASPLFQVFSVTHEARPAGSGEIAGVSDAKDGDVLVSMVGSLYSHKADLTIEDSEADLSANPSADAFIGIVDVPAQPGGA